MAYALFVAGRMSRRHAGAAPSAAARCASRPRRPAFQRSAAVTEPRARNRAGHPWRDHGRALSSAAPVGSSAGRPRPPDGDAPKPFGGRERSKPSSRVPAASAETSCPWPGSAAPEWPPRLTDTVIQRTTRPVPPFAKCRVRRRRAQEGRCSKSIMAAAVTDLRLAIRGARADRWRVWRHQGATKGDLTRFRAGSWRRLRGRIPDGPAESGVP